MCTKGEKMAHFSRDNRHLNRIASFSVCFAPDTQKRQCSHSGRYLDEGRLMLTATRELEAGLMFGVSCLTVIADLEFLEEITTGIDQTF